MILDRRNQNRAGLTRRRGARTPTWKRITWRQQGQRKGKRGLLVNLSETGLALLTELDEAPPVGTRIRVGSNGQTWPREASVVRVDCLSTTTRRVAAEFV